MQQALASMLANGLSGVVSYMYPGMLFHPILIDFAHQWHIVICVVFINLSVMVYVWQNLLCVFTGISFDFKNDLAPRSIEGRKVVYINPVTMGCAQWEGYCTDVRRRLAMGKDIDRLVGITQFLTLDPFLSIFDFG